MVGLVLAVTVIAFEATAVVTVMPTITADLDGDTLYGAAFAAFMLANLVSIVVSAEQADRRGPVASFLRRGGRLQRRAARRRPRAVDARAHPRPGPPGRRGRRPGRNVLRRRRARLPAGAPAEAVRLAVGRLGACPASSHRRPPASSATAGVGAGSSSACCPSSAVLVVLALPALVRLGRPGGRRRPRRTPGEPGHHRPCCSPPAPACSSPGIGAGSLVPRRAAHRRRDRRSASRRCGGSCRVARPGRRRARRRPSPAGSSSTSRSSAPTRSCRSPRPASTALRPPRPAWSSSAVRWPGPAGRRCRPAGTRARAARIVAVGFALVAVGLGGRGADRLGRLPALGRVPDVVRRRLRHRRRVQHHLGVGAVVGAERAGRPGRRSNLQIADTLGFAIASGVGGALVGLADRGVLDLGPALASCSCWPPVRRCSARSRHEASSSAARRQAPRRRR